MSQPKFKPGDDVLHKIENVKYRIIHIADKIRIDGNWVNRYGACRITWSHKPDRRYLRVPGPDEHVGRFKVFVLKETYISLINQRGIIIMKELNKTVFPSTERSISVEDDPEYGGAHLYVFQNSRGFNNGIAESDQSTQKIQFVQKNADGTMIPGVQSEQLLIALVDRHKKLNDKFPSREGALAITKMEEALHWLQARVEERISRGVMGNLKK